MFRTIDWAGARPVRSTEPEAVVVTGNAASTYVLAVISNAKRRRTVCGVAPNVWANSLVM